MRALVLVVALAAAPLLGADENPSIVLLRSALDPNPTLRTWVAAASLSAQLHGPVPIRKTFFGTAYYRRPQEKIVFRDVEGPLRRFSTLDTNVPTFADVTTHYTTVPVSDDGTTSTYALVPKAHGRVTSITLAVRDTDALATRVVWAYSDGSRLTVEPTYTSNGIYHLAALERIAARFPAYSVDGTLRLTDFRLNSAIEPSIFQGSYYP